MDVIFFFIFMYEIDSMSHLLSVLTSSFSYEFYYDEHIYVDCISVNIDQFSSKFRYVVAKTIFFKTGFYIPVASTSAVITIFHFDDVIIVKILIKGLMSKTS